jgi:hypothetical protein
METAILDDCDFDLLEERSRALGVNLMIGSSDETPGGLPPRRRTRPLRLSGP